MTMPRQLRFWVLFAVAVAALWPAGAMAGPANGTSRYPDLKTLPPSDLALDEMTVGAKVHHLLRFSTVVADVGEGPLELHGSPHFPPDGLYDAYQRIYQSPAGFRDVFAGTFVYHPQHNHFHFDDFARFELWTKRQFARASATNFRRGHPVAISDKVSFCMFDDTQVDTSPTVLPVPTYTTCTPLMEGISVGWGDTYSASFYGQWVDVGTAPLADGEYVIRNIADPFNLIWESPGKADPARESDIANGGITSFRIAGGALTLQ